MRWAAQLAFASLGSATAFGAAQDLAPVEVEVRVTTISGRNVYLDAGREAGLEVGDVVRFVPSQGALLAGRLDAVSRSSAQFEAGERARDLQPGDLGVVLVPAERLARAAEPVPDDLPAQAPEHPPWTDPTAEWDLSTPLLAPAQSVSPEKREQQVRGRIYDSFQMTWDRNGPDRRYVSNRTGVDLTFENPFGQADAIRLRTEYLQRVASTDGEADEREQALLIDRFSYTRGGQRTLPHRLEVGRFLPIDFPEFGLLDGVEYARRLDSGSLLGTSFGFLPLPDDTLSNDDDMQAAVFYRNGSRENGPFTWAGGYQKTWHQGRADRDLVVLKGDYLPTPTLSFFGTAWIDIYGSGDEIKTTPVELTELNLNGTYSGPRGHGASVFYTRLRWPELLRQEFAVLSPEQVRDNHNERIGLSGWLRLADPVRLSGRVDHWEDQDTSGENGEVRVDLRDLLYDRGNVALTVFRIGGAFRAGTGLRGTASKSLATGFLSASLETTRFDSETSFSTDEILQQHAARASYDWAPAGMDLSLFAEQRFGDGQDAFLLGFLIQKRF